MCDIDFYTCSSKRGRLLRNRLCPRSDGLIQVLHCQNSHCCLNHGFAALVMLKVTGKDVSVSHVSDGVT